MFKSLDIKHKEKKNSFKKLNKSYENFPNHQKTDKYILLSLNEDNFDSSSQNESIDVFNENNFDLLLNIKRDLHLNINKSKQKETITAISKNAKKNNIINENIIKDNSCKNNRNIFNIDKITKLGRHNKYSNKEGKHNKYQKDNIIRKFKVHLINSIYTFINSLFKINDNKSKRKINVLKRLTSSKIKSISKEDNIKWLNTKLKDIFSQDITTKYYIKDINYNKKIIKRIYEKKEEKRVIDILEKTVKDMWHIYINETKDSNYKNFKTLKDEIRQLKIKGETDTYITEYKNVSLHFENIFSYIIPRRRRIINNEN